MKSPPACANINKEEYKEDKERGSRERSRRSRSKSKNKIPERRPSPPDLPSGTPEPPVREDWFQPDPTPSHPSRPDNRRAPRPLVPPLHETLQEEKKTKKAPPGKAPPAQFAKKTSESQGGAASSAPRSGLAPHPEGHQHREPYLSDHQRRRRQEPRYIELNWAPHRAFRVGLDWHGLLDRNLNLAGVFDVRTSQLIGALNTRALPVEFAIVSFAGHERARDLEPELATFVEIAGDPFCGLHHNEGTCWAWSKI